MSKGVIGRLHSYETLGALDGPGVRFVAFLQGCNLRCLYCHNPDTWQMDIGNIISSDKLVEIILTYKNFIRDGGVTLSGGEPLLQPEFCAAVIELCKQNGLHTAIDTNGTVPLQLSKKAIDLADLIMLDIKDIDNEDAKILTGEGNENVIATLNYCEGIGKEVWIRHVLVPEYTIFPDKLERLAQFLTQYSCISRIELLPYHKMGDYKWDELGIENKLKSVKEPDNEEIAAAKEIFANNGLPVR
ncbi:MAG: pyruvate formate lyase-activating protein [Clostridiales bacterium]|nr:pyruvate formate lyase-activating protein [Clostridiales bacterium]